MYVQIQCFFEKIIRAAFALRLEDITSIVTSILGKKSLC